MNYDKFKQKLTLSSTLMKRIYEGHWGMCDDGGFWYCSDWRDYDN